MENIIQLFKVDNISWSSLWAILCMICSFIFGELNGLLIALLIFMTIDFITGLIVATINHNVKSQKCWIGLAKKGITLFLVAIANSLDVHILGSGSTLRTGVIGFYLANEGISILENAGLIGIPLPQKLKKVLEELSEETKDDNKKDKEDK